jgi:hypothetical protein
MHLVLGPMYALRHGGAPRNVKVRVGAMKGAMKTPPSNKRPPPRSAR